MRRFLDGSQRWPGSVLEQALVVGVLPLETVEQRLVVAHQAHLARVEIGECHSAQIDFPVQRIAVFRGLERIGLGTDRRAGKAVFQAAVDANGLGRDFTVGELAAGRRFGPHEAVENLIAQRLERVGGIGIGEAAPVLQLLAGAFLAAAVVVELALDRLLDELHAWPVDERDGDTGFDAADVALERRAQRRQCVEVVQIQRFRQRDLEALRHDIAQHRVDLGLG